MRILGPLAFFPLSLLLVLGSCSSVPENLGSASRSPLERLEGGGRLYFFADLQKSRTLVNVLLSEQGSLAKDLRASDLQALVNRTASVAGALYPKEAARSYLLLAQGDYPSLRLNFSLFWDRNWKSKKSASGFSYWRSEDKKVSLFLSPRWVSLSDGEPSVQGPGNGVPDGFDRMARGALLVGWADDPTLWNQSLSFSGISLPITRFLFALYPAADGSGTTLVLRFQTPSATQARSVGALLSIGRRLIPRGSAENPWLDILLGKSALVEDTDVVVSSSPLGDRDLALLFKTLLVYFQR